MEEKNTKSGKKTWDLLASGVGVQRIVELIDENIDVSIDIDKIGTSKNLTDANGKTVGTMEPRKQSDGRWYYALHIKNDEYEIDGKVNQNGVCCIWILNGEFKDYTVEFTFTETKQGFMPRQIELSNPNDEKISLGWCTWGQEGFEISNPYASVSYSTSMEYNQNYNYPEGNSLELRVKPSLESKGKLILHEIIEERIAPMKKIPNKIFDQCEIQYVVQTLRTHTLKQINGCTIDQYISNDHLGFSLLSQFDCIYSKLPFNKSLKEIIGESLIKSSWLSLFFEAVDKEKEESPEQKMKKLDAIV